MIEIPGTIWHGIRLGEIKSLAHMCEGFRAYGRNPCTILDYKDERIVENPGIIMVEIHALYWIIKMRG